MFSKTLVEMKNTLKPYAWYCEIENDGYARIWDSDIPSNRRIFRGMLK